MKNTAKIKNAQDVRDAARHPDEYFEDPHDVAEEKSLSPGDKERILDSWAEDARSQTRAAGEGMGASGPTVSLQEVRDAKREVSEERERNAEGIRQSKSGPWFLAAGAVAVAAVLMLPFNWIVSVICLPIYISCLFAAWYPRRKRKGKHHISPVGYTAFIASAVALLGGGLWFAFTTGRVGIGLLAAGLYAALVAGPFVYLAAQQSYHKVDE